MGKAIGRPKNIEGLELIELDECIKRVTEYLNLAAPPFNRRTLRNKLSRGEFQRYGTYHQPQVDWGEVKRSLHWRRKVS